MRIKIDPSALRETRWYEVSIRFLLGGLITAGAGIIAEKFGPGIGGLFLAFPAIFPAGATLIDKHEREKKELAGVSGAERGRKAAAIDATGAAMGSIGLLLFAVVVQKFIVSYNPWLVLPGSMGVWLVVSLIAWQIRRRL